MYRNKLPHYINLRNILNHDQLLNYRNLTNDKGILLFPKIEVLKKQEKVVIFSNNNYVFKFLLNRSERFYEIFYTYLYSYHIVNSLSDENSSLIILKRYDYFSHINFNRYSLDLFEENLKSQIIDYHQNFTIHNDIKPNNIVKNSDRSINLKWIIIDFGLMGTYHPNSEYIPQLNFEIGTKKYMPEYKNIERLPFEERLFFMYMKDWYSYGIILMEQGDEMGSCIVNIIDKMNISQIKTFFKDYLSQNDLFYLKSHKIF